MTKIGESPFVWLEFDKEGGLENGALQELADELGQSGATDLVVVSHGWKNDRAAAKRLYETLWNNVVPKLTAKAEKIVVAGVLWPAKEFRTDFDEEALRAAGEDKAAGLGGGARASEDLSEDEFKIVVAQAAELLKSDALADLAYEAAEDAAKALALFREGERAAQVGGAGADAELAPEGERLRHRSEVSATTALVGLQAPPLMEPEGGAQGLGDMLSGVFNGGRAAVARLLNQFTYYEMKRRAGVVGGSLGRELSDLKPAQDVRMHLIGHSFGARLVTAAAKEYGSSPKLKLQSLTMLQGAFSHHGLAPNFQGEPGAFHDVVGKPEGPIAITHTHNDKACTLAYAVASRLSGDKVSAVGDANDPFGAMGANGAQKVAVRNHTLGVPIPPGKGIYNFKADAFVKDHGDVTNAKCGELVAAVMRA